MKKTIALLMALVMVLCLLPSMTLAALDTGHRIDVRFTVLYVGSEFKIGYSYGSSEKTTFVCQYSTPHSDNAYNNHTIAISDIKAAAERATVNSGYEITGWTKKASANPEVWGFNEKEPTACNKGNTIYLVAKRTQPQTQTITLTYNANGGSGAPAAQTKDSTNGKASFTISNQIPSRQNYDFAGWSTDQNATSAMYQPNANIEISQDTTLYAVWNNHEHKDANNDGFCDTDRTCMHDHDNDGYCTEDNCTHTDTCCPKRNDDEDDNKPKPENTPTIDPNMNSIVSMENIKVKCTTDTTNHAEKTYGLIDNGFEVSSSNTWEDNVGYTRNITLKKDVYLAKYNADYPNTNHTLSDNDPISIKIVWDNSSAKWKPIAKVDVTIKVQCETPEPTPPAKPDDHDTLKDLLGKIKVTCVTSVTAHGTKGFDLIDGSYTVGDVEGNANIGYTCKVSISPAKYVEAYNVELSLVHTTDDTAKIVTLKYNNDSAWVVDRGTPVEFNVKCETPQPTPPAKPTDNDVPGIIDRKAVKVHCINDSSGSDDHSYNILPGSFSVGDVILKDGVYTCDITVYPELYVDKYVEDFGKPHTLSPAGQTGTITLRYYAENQVWDLMPNYDLPIVFTVTCSDEDETFTVTYLDGFSGTYATYTNLNYGDPTPVPANPYRSGYIFLGWEPSVAPTVTGDARYVAQWRYIGPQYPNPTPVQPVQPGILPPQTGDMPLWYAIARFLGLVK